MNDDPFNLPASGAISTPWPGGWGARTTSICSAPIPGAGNEHLIREMYSGLPEPDVALFLGIAPEAAFRRVGERGIDSEELSFLNGFDLGYRLLPEMERLTVVDAAQDFAEVRRTIRAVLREKFADLSADRLDDCPDE